MIKNFKEVFEELKSMFINADVSNVEDLAFQFRIIGEGSGVFYAEVKNHKLSIEPYNYNDKDAEFVGTYDVFKNIISGKSNPITMYCLGKIKVNGNLEKACKINYILK